MGKDMKTKFTHKEVLKLKRKTLEQKNSLRIKKDITIQSVYAPNNNF